MSPVEKAEGALNDRVAVLQAHLRAAQTAAAQQAFFQALLVCFAVGEALADYVRSVSEYARGRHGEIKQVEQALAAEHLILLQKGTQLLEQLKSNPADKAVRKEIERSKRGMEGLQKKLRRGTYSLRSDLAPSLAAIDKVALTIRRFGEAGDIDGLKEVVKAVVGHAHELYRTQPGLAARDIVDTAVWGKAALAGVDHATEFQEAFARAGYQVLLALDLMRMTLSPTPPKATEEAIRHATEAIAERLKATAGRFAG
jgi:hypothetical protein